MRRLSTLLGLCLVSVFALAQAPPTLRPNLHRQAGPQPAGVAAQRTDPTSRLSGELQQIYQYSRTTGIMAARGAAGTAALQAAFPALSLTGSQRVLVRIMARDVATLRPLLEARGFITVSDKSKFHFLEGELPVSQLAPGATGISALASQGLLGVMAVLQPETHTGRVPSQADYALHTNRVRATRPTGYNGSGFKVGVMSDSYNALGGAEAGVASGDLPAGVTVLQDRTADQGGTDEGRAMIELIHDLAPGAGKAFSAIFRGEADFADQLLQLADPTMGNCKIIVDDISYLDEPMFQDGVVGQAVNEVSDNLKVSYFGAAGNQGDASCEYVNPVFTSSSAATTAAAELDFGASFKAGGTSDTRQHVKIPEGTSFRPFLQWSDPFYTTNGVKTDLDMYLIRTHADGMVQSGDTVRRSTIDNLTFQVPIEHFSSAYVGASDTDTEFDLVIVRRAGTANPARVKYISYGDALHDDPAKAGIQLEYFTHSSTVTGHHAAIGNISVAAAPAYQRVSAESFTSKGGPAFLFNPDGSPLPAPQVRAKPDFTSVDGISNTFFGQKFAGQDPKEAFLFFGTSAAAPNAAAVAALLLQSSPDLTPTQVNERLKSTAHDIGAPGYDVLTGAGLINAYDAVFGPQTAMAAPFVETFDNAGLSRAWDLQGGSYGRILVRAGFGPATPPGHLVMDGILTAAGLSARRNSASLKLDLRNAPADGWLLTFKHKKFGGEKDEPMPATFTGNPNVDGVAMSTDGGTTWFRVADITGANATTSYQTVSVNLSALATANGLNLNDNVLLRFQHYGSGEVDSTLPAFGAFIGGRAFDDVAVTSATPAPVAAFASNAPASASCPGITVKFTDASLFAPTSYRWTFPGGTPATSTEVSPTITYNTAGTYDVTLTVTNANGTSTRTTKAAVRVAAIKPTASFTFRQLPICIGNRIRFTNTSINCASTYRWTFAGGTPATSTEVSPTVTYNAAGTYDVTLVAANPNGASAPKTFTVVVQDAGLAIPYAESFSSGIPANWGVLNPDGGLSWTTAPNTLRKDGTRGTVLVMPFATYAAVGQADTLQSPIFDLRNQSLAFLRFDLAHAPVTGANDGLGIEVYTACTSTRLAEVYHKTSSTGLATTLPRDNTVYVPTSTSQWRPETVDLAPYLGQQIYLRFVAYNDYGNNLYLSNIRIENTPTLLAARPRTDSPALQAFPNPVAGGARLLLVLPPARGTATVRVLDAVGRVSSQFNMELSPTASIRRALTSPLAAGLYTVLCQTADGQLYSRRVVVE